MRDFFRTMDLYKGMILGCLVLLPAAGAWTWWLHGRLARAETAVAKARLPQGDLAMIGLLQKQIEKQARQSQQIVGDTENYYQTYLAKQILDASAGGGGIKSEDFAVGILREHPVTKLKAVDYEVDITFGGRAARDRFALPRDFLNYVIYNIESQLPLFKLRKLEIVNKLIQDQNLRRGEKPPPPELPDEWYVEKMIFVKREPK